MLPHIAVISHRRSGTHLTIDALCNNFPVYGAFVDEDSGTDAIVHEARTRPIVLKTHGFSLTHLEDLGIQFRKLYVVRDGRDVMVSLFNYMRRFHPEVRWLSFSEFLRTPNSFDLDVAPVGLSRPAFWAYHVRHWSSRPDVLVVPYSDWIDDFRRTLVGLSAALGVPPPAHVRSTVRRGGPLLTSELPRRAFERAYRFYMRTVSGIRHTSVSFDRGDVGRWRDYFHDRDLEYYEQETANALGVAAPVHHR
jgi:hypothetical protein